MCCATHRSKTRVLCKIQVGEYCLGEQDIKAIILAGSCDFRRCAIASRLPMALWPVVGKGVLEQLIRSIAEQGVRHMTICSNGDSSILKETLDVGKFRDLDVRFLDEPLPVGTAGAVRDAVNGNTDELLLVFFGTIVCPPDIGLLITAHRNQEADLTVALNPASEGDETNGGSVNGYVCNPSVLEYIPAEGYYDIKESLIPEMIRLGKRVRCATLQHSVGNFHNRQGYLNAISNYLESATDADIGLKTAEQKDNHVIWKGSEVTVESGARIYGRVVLLDGVCIETGAVIFGPAILGRNVKIGSGSVVVNSILWNDSQVGDNCEVQQSIVDYNAFVPSNSVVTGKSVVFEPKGKLENFFGGLSKVVEDKIGKLERRQKPQLEGVWGRPQKQQRKFLHWLAAGVVLIAFLWSYWPGIMDLLNIWQRSDEYSSGLLVPFLAIYILWSRRKQITGIHIRPCLWGMLAFVVVQAVRFFGLFFMYGSAERLSVVLSIAALVLLLLGWEFFRKVSPIVLFLFLMLPWPNRVQETVGLPLQHWATSSAVFCLETIGYEVVREGNVIHIGQASVAVAEACNGLRMITAFFIIGGLVALLIERAWWQKLIVFASSLPIALFCNTLRLVLTAVAFTAIKGEYWENIFHDFGGYAMMPLALALVVGELWFLAKLTTAPIKNRIVVRKSTKRPIRTKGQDGRRVNI
ncbi:MAG: exosortase [Planctomycetota bacterium]